MVKLEGTVIKEFLTRKTPLKVDDLPELSLRRYGQPTFTSLEHLAEIERRYERDSRSKGKPRKLLDVNVTDWVRFEPQIEYAVGLVTVAQNVVEFFTGFLGKDYFKKPFGVFSVPKNAAEVQYQGLERATIYLVADLRQNIVVWHSLQEGQRSVIVKSGANVKPPVRVGRAILYNDGKFSFSDSNQSPILLKSTSRPLEFIDSVFYAMIVHGLGKYSVENLNGSIKRGGQVTPQVVSALMHEYARLERITALAVSKLITQVYAEKTKMPLSQDEIEAFHKRYQEDPTLRDVNRLIAHLRKATLRESAQYGLRLYVNRPLILQQLLR